MLRIRSTLLQPRWKRCVEELLYGLYLEVYKLFASVSRKYVIESTVLLPMELETLTILATEWDSGPVQVTPCSDGMYCCGKNNTECCHQHQGTYAFQGVPINATSSGSGSGAKMSGASIAGIVVGIVGVISLGVCVYLLLRLRNEKSPKSFTSRTQESVYLHDHMAPNPEAPPPLHPQPSTVSRNHPSTSLHSKPSVRSHYVAEKRLPELPKEVYEMGGEGVTRFEVSGSAVKKEDRKFWS